MKKYILQLLTCFSIGLSALFCSCSGMYDNVDKYIGEQVYPAQFDTIFGKIGYERVEIDLLSAGRIPASQIVMGKAKKTIIEFNNAASRDTAIIIDSLCSWVNIQDLTLSKMYRFRISTLDQYGNKSVPQEIALIPYTASDKASLSLRGPNLTMTPSSVVIDWLNSLSTVQGDYVSLTYNYTDVDGIVRTGASEGAPRIFAANLPIGSSYSVNVDAKMIPKVEGKRILDTVTISTTIEFVLPDANEPFTPKERAILEANGATTFTVAGVSSISKLYLPPHIGTLEDLIYFSGVREIDFTGGTVAKLPVLTYTGNSVTSPVGGGDWQPFMRRVEFNVQGILYLTDLMDLGIISKVYYAPNSMGLDNVLAPYIATGQVELVTMPEEVLITNQFFADGRVQDNAWGLDLTYNPNDAPAGTGLLEIYKAQCRQGSASFIVALPKEYRWNFDEYRYLKMKVWTPTIDFLTGTQDVFKGFWPRFMNHLWSFGGNSTHGQAYWAPSIITVPDNQLGTQWVDLTVDMNNIGGDANTAYNRVVVFNIGGERGVTPSSNIIWYFSNIRISKTR
jgi:hypothetical protein